MSADARAPRKGDRVEVLLERFDAKGRAVGSVSGAHGDREVSVRAAPLGARAAVEILRRRRGRLEGRLVEILEPGALARDARCPHFGTCGGCAFQTTAYEGQLAELRRHVGAALAAQGITTGVDAVIGCDEPWHYRNKMDFTFASRRWIEPHEPEGAERGFALGLHVAGVFQKVLDVRSCSIHFEEADGLLTSVRALARERELSPWDNRAHTGLLRHLVLRKGFRTGEILVDIVTSADAPELVEPLCAALLARHPEVTTFVQNVNTRPAAIAVGEREHVLFGPGVIHERLLDLDFAISANSFFQTNTVQAERLFAMVREEARCAAGDVVFDLYCGAGTIALVLAADAREVWGFESVPSAVADARANAAANGITGARFVEGDVLASLASPEGRPRPDVCVVDPPRAGLHPAVPPALLALAPRRIVYVSCNVAAAARELPVLLAGGYRLARARPIDLFPHTPHVEVVLTLERTRDATGT